MAVRANISVSLDGYVAGPNPTMNEPLGEGGERLHGWVIATETWRAQHGMTGGERNADAAVVNDVVDGIGAYIMGRKMFDGGSGPLDPNWHGWWGDDPPYHAPVFVLTHHAREPLVMHGGTTFTFVTEGIESALARARGAGGEGDVAVIGGAETINQYLAAGLLDELYLHIAPVILGGGARLLVNVGDPSLTPEAVVESPAVTHIKYRVG